MTKQNFISKKLRRIILSTNTSIENYFNLLKTFLHNFKKFKINNNSKVFIAIGVTVIFIISYFLIPTTYNKENIKQNIKNQILKKYNIDIKFNNKITYALLPRPHFTTKKLSILRNDKSIGEVGKFRAFISIDKLFFFQNFELKDLVLNKSDFNIKKGDLVFFKNLLETEASKNKIIFKDSNIFFQSYDDEVLFINKIKNGKFFYDSNNLENIFVADNEVFNIPYKLRIKNNKFNKKIYTNLQSKKIRLNLKNQIDYGNPVKNGILDILFVNKKTSVDYEIKKNSLNYSSENNKNTYYGRMDFKPFYLNSSFNYDGLSFKNILKQDSIVIDIIKSEIFNNKNLNANLNLNVKDIINFAELNNLALKISVLEGDLSLSDSTILWKNDVKIKLNESIFIYGDDGINLIGKIILDFKNLDNFYKSFQINKNNRKKISSLEFDFIYNLSQKKITLDNIKIDNANNQGLDKFINNFNNSRKSIFNKITFKNFISNFFDAYAG